MDKFNAAKKPIMFYVISGAFIVWLLGLTLYSFHLRIWGHDALHHLAKLAELYDPFSRGLFNNSLSPQLHFGEGLPAYVFYSQWSYIPAFIFTTMGFALQPAFGIVSTLLLLVAWSGFYRLARIYAPANTAYFGSIIFVTCNYLIGDAYARFAYTEFFAYAFLPWAVFSLHHALISGTRAQILFAIAMSSTMILIHPLTFINCFPLLALYCLMILRRQSSLTQVLIRGAIVSVASVALTAFYWLPGLIEKPYVLGEGGLNIHYTRSYWTFDMAVLNTQHWLSLGPFLTATLGLAILTHLLLIRRFTKGYWLLSGILFYLFMCTPWSSLVWENVTILQANQFVTRMILPLSLLAALYSVLVLNAGYKKPLPSWLVMVVSIIVLVQASAFIHTHTKAQFRTEMLTQAMPSKSMQEQIEYQLGPYIKRTNGWGVSEFRPRVDMPEYLVSEPACLQAMPLPSYVTDLERQYIAFNYQVPTAGCYIRLPILWHVRYRATDANGRDLAIFNNINGYMMLRTIDAQGSVSIKFTKLGYVRWSQRVSKAVFFIMLLIALFGAIQRLKTQLGSNDTGEASNA